MSTQEAYRDIIEDVRKLVTQAGGRKGTLILSVDVAARLEAIAAPTGAPLEAPPETGVPSEPAGAAPEMPPAGEGAEAELAALAETVRGCTRCGLAATRTQTVFGVGNPSADLVFVGEAPGADEDRQGEPFVGRAGQLLTDIIVKGMKMRREDVYICNVLKCRPPGNRDPKPSEVACCEPFLLRQLELIRPKVICALGRSAAQTLLGTTESTGRLRGRWHDYHGIPLRVTYHPAYLLRKPSEKSKTWDDVKEILKLLAGETKI